jgi:hypothetical protein
MPDDAAIDGETSRARRAGSAVFNTLPNWGSSPAAVFYYVFDVLVLGGRNLMRELGVFAPVAQAHVEEFRSTEG